MIVFFEVFHCELVQIFFYNFASWTDASLISNQKVFSDWWCVCDHFQAQQSNLVQVARSLGRAVPLSPQLIFTPTATVTAVQSESSTQASSQVG